MDDRHPVRGAAAYPDLHLLLLACRPGGLLVADAAAALGRRQHLGRARQFPLDPGQCRLLEFHHRQHDLCRHQHGPCDGHRAGARRPDRPAACRLVALSRGADLALRHRRAGAGAGISFHPGAGGRLHGRRQQGLARLLGPRPRRRRRDGIRHHRLFLEICRLQLHLLPRCLAGDPAFADRGGGDGRLRRHPALLGHPVPADHADDLLPAGHQHHREFPGFLRHRRHHDRRRAGQRHQSDGLQDLFRRLQRPGLLRRGRAEHHPDALDHRAHHRPVPLHRAARALS